MNSPDLKKIPQKMRRGLPTGTFGLSLLFHGVLLFLIGGVVLVQGVVPRIDFMEVPVVDSPVAEEVALPAPEEPEQVPSLDTAKVSPTAAGETTDTNPWIETAVVTTMQPSLQMAPMDGAKSMLGSDSILSGSKTGTTGSGKGGVRNMGSVFGSKGGGANALTGYLYDLKQTSDRKPSNMAGVTEELADNLIPENVRALEVVKDFIKHWDESILQKYYRSPDTLASYQFFIPTIDAGAAPEAFGVDKEVKPRRWLVHYKGQVTAAADARFRFVGLGDDVLIVRFQNKVVFDGSWTLVDPDANSKEIYTFLASLYKKMRVGSWISVKAGETYDFEILIGEIPGGKFSTCLLVEEKNKQYKARADGDGPAFPVFQTAPTKVPAYERSGFAETAETPFVLGQ